MLRLIVANLVYHWRGNLAVLLGVAVGSAVLTGALLVGDCLQGSLKALALDQLGWVDQALVSGRFFRAALADDLPVSRAAPAILLQGSASASAGRNSKTVGKVTILGVNQKFWESASQRWDTDAAEVVLNASLARAMRVKVGDRITINVAKSDSIPRESLLGKRKAEDVLQPLTVTVREILPDQGMARFSLKPNPEPVRNAFVPLGLLQSKLDLAGRANAILVGEPKADLQPELAKRLTLDDWNLRLRTPEDRARAFVKYVDPNNRGKPLKKFKWEGRVPDELANQATSAGELSIEAVIDFYRKHRAYLSLESRQMFLEPAVVRAVEKIAHPPGLGPLRHLISGGRSKEFMFSPTLVYLADTLADGKNEVPYSVIGAIDTWLTLKDSEIVLMSWPGSGLHTKTGEKMAITYYAPDNRGQLHKHSESFVVRDVLPLTGALDDPDLTPEFPGITDKLDMGSWQNPPFPFERKRIKPADEDYWKRYRTTPRAYVSLKTGQRLWGSRFGQLTSIRITPASSKDAADFERDLLRQLDPAQGGFVFQPVKEQAIKASGGSTDFSEYFLYFSFFLIVAALMLVGLLFRLNLDRRASEIGVLLAVGWRRRQVRGLLLAEGTMLAIVGGAIGLLLAGFYARALLDFLASHWPSEQGLPFLSYHARPVSFAIGYFAALAVSVATIFWAVRALAKVAPKALLSGESVSAVQNEDKGPRWSKWIGIAFAVGAVVCLGMAFLVTGHEAQAGSFFGSGTCLMIALLAVLWAKIRTGRQRTVTGGANALARLGIRNAARHPVRSLLTIGLLASAMFVVISVQSFHRNVGSDFLDRHGGSGGFNLIVESDVPVFQDLNQPDTRRDLFLPDKVPSALKDAVFFPFRVRPGDDVSCLNLYQPLRPRLLGVPADFIRRGGFHFASILGSVTPGAEWSLLDKSRDDDVIPVFADANTATHILHLGLGDTIEVPDDQGRPRKLQIVGLLDGSIFQGELLLSDANFKKMFPRQEGFSFFLVEGPPADTEALQGVLESVPGLPGLYVTTTIDRLKGYIDVENTYLLTFQVLGGFGLLLGALGLAVVLLRSVWERRGELALLRALGFRRRTVGWFVLAENGYLLILGLGVGTLSALISVLPFLLGSGSRILWLQLICLLALVLAAGLGAAALAVMTTLRAPLLTALRRE